MRDFEELDYYTMLGVSQDADDETLRRAYREQVAQYHPDQTTDEHDEHHAYATARLERIEEAYRVLSDQRLRRAYDSDLLVTNTVGQRQPTAPASPVQPGKVTVGQQRDHPAELYQQAKDHLAEGRYGQAAATIRTLQQLAPFYRDSSALLAEAEAKRYQQDQANRAPSPAPSYRPRLKKPRSTTRRQSPWLLYGGIAVAAVLLLAVLFPFISSGLAGGGNDNAPAATVDDAPTTTPVEVGAATDTTPTPPANTDDADTADDTAPPATANADIEGGEELLNDDFAAQIRLPEQQGPGWSVGYDNERYFIEAVAGLDNLWVYLPVDGLAAQPAYSVATDVQVSDGSGGVVAAYLNESTYIAAFVNPQARTYSLERRQGGGPEELAGGRSTLIKPGDNSVNRLVLHIEEEELRLYINGEQVATATANGLTNPGQVGIVAHGRESSGAARFDNFQIRLLTEG